jgi:hypothetical protein
MKSHGRFNFTDEILQKMEMALGRAEGQLAIA